MEEHKISAVSQENNEGGATLKLTPEQKEFLRSHLDTELRNYKGGITKQYATALNGMYQQLMGENHPNWENLEKTFS